MATTLAFLLGFVFRISIWLGIFVLLVKSLELRISDFSSKYRQTFLLILSLCLMLLFSEIFMEIVNLKILLCCCIITLLFTFVDIKNPSSSATKWWTSVTKTDYIILGLIVICLLIFAPLSLIIKSYTMLELMVAMLWFIFLGSLQTANKKLSPSAHPYSLKQRGTAILVGSGIYSIFALLFLFVCVFFFQNTLNAIIENILQYALLAAIFIPAIVRINFHDYLSENAVLFFLWMGGLPYINYLFNVVGYNNKLVFMCICLLSASIAIIQFKNWKIFTKVLILSLLWGVFLLL